MGDVEMPANEAWLDACGDGWAPIIRETHERLSYLDPGYTIQQVKEKFGGLRFYFTAHTDNETVGRIMDDVVTAAEARCSYTCEVCGLPGELREVSYWYRTVCRGHYLEWVGDRRAVLENSDEVLLTHRPSTCHGEFCTVHNRSDHHMRSWPQHWRSDRGIMERVCVHGVGHPDPDEYKLAGPGGAAEGVHGCDGCCVVPGDGA